MDMTSNSTAALAKTSDIPDNVPAAAANASPARVRVCCCLSVGMAKDTSAGGSLIVRLCGDLANLTLFRLVLGDGERESL